MQKKKMMKKYYLLNVDRKHFQVRILAIII